MNVLYNLRESRKTYVINFLKLQDCYLIILQVQDIVVGNKNFTDVTKPSEIVQLLLNEDQLANLESTTASSAKKNGKKTPGQADSDAAVRDLWNDEGDEFFGQPTQPQGGARIEEVEEGDGTPAPTAPSGRGRKRKGDGAPSTRGRKPGTRGGRKKAQAPPADS